MKIRLPTLHKLQDSLPTDKTLHFTVSYVLMGLLYLLFSLSLPVSVGIVATIGIAKEYIVDDVVDHNDILADMLGIALFVLCVMW
jgi:hypothetical protein